MRVGRDGLGDRVTTVFGVDKLKLELMQELTTITTTTTTTTTKITKPPIEEVFNCEFGKNSSCSYSSIK